MAKTLVNLQDLRRRIYRKAKSDKAHRFLGIFVHVMKMETLREAYHLAKMDGGASSTDGLTFDEIEEAGLDEFLLAIRNDFLLGSYQPLSYRKVEIPKGNGKVRTLQIPTIHDRMVQGALRLIPEAIFESDFCPNPYGFRSKRLPHSALAEVSRRILRRMTRVFDVDLMSARIENV